MPSPTSKFQRFIASLPFIALTLFCLHHMDLVKMANFVQPFLDSGKIEWSNDGGGSIPVLSRFHYLEFLDDVWRGPAINFAPSAVGFDAVSSWQMFAFLNDVGPLYVVLILESTRVGNAWSPAFLPTLCTWGGQFVGLGSIAPVFYFLCFIFAPSATELANSPAKKKLVREHCIALLPSVLILHTSEVFGTYVHPDPETRHYWSWAWQMAPLYLGVANSTISRLISLTPAKRGFAWMGSPKLVLSVMSLVSVGVWAYTALWCEFSLSTIFLPDPPVQSEFAAHMRRGLQFDEISVFTSSFLWLAYSFFDLFVAGLIGREWVVAAVVFPLASVLVGPGAAFAAGWYWREVKLQAKRGRD